MDFKTLEGRTLKSVTQIDDDVIEFVTVEGGAYRLHHCQDCCESVVVDDISGDLADLVGEPILLAEEAESTEPPAGRENYESDTWTFYKLRTIKGSVDIRWHGSSNGYYSERVDFDKVA